MHIPSYSKYVDSIVHNEQCIVRTSSVRYFGTFFWMNGIFKMALIEGRSLSD